MNVLKSLMIAALVCSSTVGYSTEITPIIGYRGGGEFTDEETQQKHSTESSEIYGIILGFPYDHDRNWEIYYSHQSSSIRSVSLTQPAPASTADIPLTIDYLHLGGTAPISESEKLKTFVSGGFGLTYMTPDFSGFDSDLRPSLSVGLGMKYQFSDSLALRMESRALGTLFSNSSSLFCDGGCRLSVSGSLFTQAEAFAGLAFSF